MIEVKDEFVLDIKYITKNNFMNEVLYQNYKCFLREGTYKKLKKANDKFKKLGFQIKIWDAYRPFSVQEYMWNKVHDVKYVSNTYVKTYHSKGNAVDITLCDLYGNELKMPTLFDDFSTNAKSNYIGNNVEIKENLNLLQKVMMECGFTFLETEWWHFNDTDDYPIIKEDLF